MVLFCVWVDVFVFNWDVCAIWKGGRGFQLMLSDRCENLRRAGEKKCSGGGPAERDFLKKKKIFSTEKTTLDEVNVSKNIFFFTCISVKEDVI